MTYLLRGIWAGCFGVSSPAYIFRADLHHVMEPYGHGPISGHKSIYYFGAKSGRFEGIRGAKIGTES